MDGHRSKYCEERTSLSKIVIAFFRSVEKLDGCQTGPAEPLPEPPGREGAGLVRGPALKTAAFFYLDMILIRVTMQH